MFGTITMAAATSVTFGTVTSINNKTTMRRLVVFAALLAAWPCAVAFQPRQPLAAVARTTRSGRQQQQPLLLAASSDDRTTSDIFNLLEANQRGKQQRLAQDKNYFNKPRTSNAPKCLWIGCADARVPSDELLGQDADNIFVVRNVANLVMPSDLNLLSVVEYAVNEMNVENIVICGHYDCESLRVATQLGGQWSPLQYWLRNVEDVYRLHRTELDAIADPEQRHRRLVELNVFEQRNNLYKTGLVPRGPNGAGSNGPVPQVHACVFDSATGDLRLLSADGSALIGPAESGRSSDTGEKAAASIGAESAVEAPKGASVKAAKATKVADPPKQAKDSGVKPVTPAAKPFPFKVSPFAKKPTEADDKADAPAKQTEKVNPASPVPAAKAGKPDPVVPPKTADSPRVSSPGQSPFFADKKKKVSVETDSARDKNVDVSSKSSNPELATAAVNPLEVAEPREFMGPPPPRDMGPDMFDPRFGPPMPDPRFGPPMPDPRFGPPMPDPRFEPPMSDPRFGPPVPDPRSGPPETSPRPQKTPGRSIVDVITSAYDEANSWWGKTYVVNKEQVQTYVKTRDPSGRRSDAYFAPEGSDAATVAPSDVPPPPRAGEASGGPAIAASSDALPVVDPFLSPTDAWWNQGDVFRKDQVQTYVKQSLPTKRGDDRGSDDQPVVDEPGEYFESSDKEGAVAEYASDAPLFPDQIRPDGEGMDESRPRARPPVDRGLDKRAIPRRVDVTGTGPDSWWEKSELFREDQVQTFLRKRRPE